MDPASPTVDASDCMSDTEFLAKDMGTGRVVTPKRESPALTSALQINLSISLGPGSLPISRACETQNALTLLGYLARRRPPSVSKLRT